MKNYYFIIIGCLLLSASIFAQAPEAINYQGVARDNSGNVIASQTVSLRLSILSGSSSGTAVYVETHSKITDGYGLFSLQIGNGAVVSGVFSNINWSINSNFLKVEIDPSGGTAYQLAGTSQLVSVPYALHAKTAISLSSGETDPIWTSAIPNYYTKTNMQTSGASLFHFNNLTNKPTTIAGYGITDAMTTAHPANAITALNITNWNTAFSWGNHNGLYRPISYVPSWGEITSNPFLFTAPVNNQLIRYNSTSGKWENWTSNFLTNYTETDPIWTSAIPNYFTKTNMQTGGSSQLHFNNLTNKPTTIAGYGITDAMTITHPAYEITALNITNWNIAYGWGNHSGLYRPISYVPSWGEITSNPFLFTAPVNNQLIRYNSTSSKWENWTSNFLTNYTETDPIWTSATPNYYTKTNMQTSGSSQLHFNNLTNKPTTIAGYGITNAITTALPSTNILIGNSSGLAAAATLSGDATLSNTGVLTLANSGVPAGQYGNTIGTIPYFTIDNKGRITTASTRSIVDNDIPDGITASNYLLLTGGTITSTNAAAFTSKSTSATGNGVIGYGNNTTYAGFPAYNGGGAFLGTAIGVYGQASNTSSERAGGFFRTDGSAYARVGGYNSFGAAKLIWGVGTVASIVKSQDGMMADMSIALNPETVITDYGVGQLENGRCSIKIDQVVAKRIFVSNEYPIKVFIQLEGDCNGVYVANKSADGFDVIELMAGKSNAPFSWTFTANLNDIVALDGSVVSKNLGTRAKEYFNPEVK